MSRRRVISGAGEIVAGCRVRATDKRTRVRGITIVCTQTRRPGRNNKRLVIIIFITAIVDVRGWRREHTNVQRPVNTPCRVLRARGRTPHARTYSTACTGRL